MDGTKTRADNPAQKILAPPTTTEKPPPLTASSSPYRTKSPPIPVRETAPLRPFPTHNYVPPQAYHRSALFRRQYPLAKRADHSRVVASPPMPPRNTHRHFPATARPLAHTHPPSKTMHRVPLHRRVPKNRYAVSTSEPTPSVPPHLHALKANTAPPDTPRICAAHSTSTRALRDPSPASDPTAHARETPHPDTPLSQSNSPHRQPNARHKNSTHPRSTSPKTPQYNTAAPTKPGGGQPVTTPPPRYPNKKRPHRALPCAAPLARDPPQTPNTPH